MWRREESGCERWLFVFLFHSFFFFLSFCTVSSVFCSDLDLMLEWREDSEVPFFGLVCFFPPSFIFLLYFSVSF